jgi:hypothetical protein
VAEVVDNAIQAGARSIRILVREERGPDRNGDLGERQVTIGVLDDGRGMDLDKLWAALQFGGTERFNDRSGLGRFGMGLPNSSVSVTRRLEVYSWCAPGQVHSTYLDIDEITRCLVRGIPRPKHNSLPRWITAPVPASGTLVVWPRCDRLEFRKSSTVAEKLRAPLGRMYRRLIWSGLRLSVNDVPLAPVDPLFCHPRTGEGGATPHGKPLHYDVAIPGTARASRVSVRFTLLPIALWHHRSVEEKHASGIVGGAGISFVRAEREIDHCWTLLGGKRKENYDDWWRCEVLFQPEVDECFGVTHSKQGVTPTPYLRAILEPDLETIARALNAEVRGTFQRLRETSPSPATERANLNDPLLPAPRRSRAMGDGFSYRIAQTPIPNAQFFDVAVRGRRVVLTLNSDHPFHDRVLSALPKSSGGRHALESLLLAAARGYVALSPEERQVARRYWSAWGDALSAFTERPRP